MLTASDIMSTDIVKVPAATTVRALARLLQAKEISGAPVVDGTGNIIGVVSTADVARAAGSELLVDFDHLTAADIMTAGTLSVRPTATIDETAAFLARAGIHRALVMDHGRLLGVVTAHDVLAVVGHTGEMPHPTHWPR
jgi:CBS domain-containing protein